MRYDSGFILNKAFPLRDWNLSKRNRGIQFKEKSTVRNTDNLASYFIIDKSLYLNRL